MSSHSTSSLNRHDPIGIEMEHSRQRALARDRVIMAQMAGKFLEISQQLEQYKDLYVRQRAEMENYARARDREMDQIKKNAGKDIIKSILPILDTMDAAMLNSKDSTQIKPLRDQMIKILSSYGFSEIQSKGKKFDPFMHEVIAVSPSEEDGIVLEEVQRGYKLNNEVIRTSKVIVGKR